MNWKELFRMQEKLDTYIENNHDINGEEIFEKKVLALLVELGELANETRCFKFWSTKAPSERSVILEEYVDGLHFIMSIGIEKGYTYEDRKNKEQNGLTANFLAVFEKVDHYHKIPTNEHYQQLFASFMALGSALGFSEKDMKEAYFAKNQVNYERQDNGY